MNRQESKELLPIIKAFSERKTIQYRLKKNEESNWDDVDKNYLELSPHVFIYRIKPSPTYRPFANAEECWNEMLKHQPVGYLKYKGESKYTIYCNIDRNCDFEADFDDYTFVDGAPFGVKVEEE